MARWPWATEEQEEPVADETSDLITGMAMIIEESMKRSPQNWMFFADEMIFNASTQVCVVTKKHPYVVRMNAKAAVAQAQSSAQAQSIIARYNQLGGGTGLLPTRPFPFDDWRDEGDYATEPTIKLTPAEEAHIDTGIKAVKAYNDHQKELARIAREEKRRKEIEAMRQEVSMRLLGMSEAKDE